MGMTFLAAGTSLPEAITSVIVTCQGFGAMGISNALGSNIFNILLCLGLPWLIKTSVGTVMTGQKQWVRLEALRNEPSSSFRFQITLNSTGITYSAISLFATLFAMYFTFMFNKFKLDRKIGISCLMFYLLFLAFASLLEFEVLYPVHRPVCTS